jgi:flagellar biosynthesis chaperone FliJ
VTQKWANCNEKLKKLGEIIATTNSLIRKGKEQLPRTDSSSVKTAEIAPELKLPNITLKKFSGNKNEFSEFSENFESAVNRNSLTNIQKFLYLKMFIEGPAEELIEGLGREDFNITMDLLKKKYGDTH